jgi:hypothetical protein
MRFQRDVSKGLGGNTKNPKLLYVNKASLSFDKDENQSTLRAFPIILYS